MNHSGFIVFLGSFGSYFYSPLQGFFNTYFLFKLLSCFLFALPSFLCLFGLLVLGLLLLVITLFVLFLR